MKLRQAGPMVALAAATLLAGCAAGGGRSNPFPEDRSQKEIKIFITNLAFMDATIYGVSTGGRHRLGRVTGRRESVFTMPMPAPSEFYLEIDMLAGPKCRTERLFVDPGDQLELIIETDNPRMVCGGS